MLANEFELMHKSAFVNAYVRDVQSAFIIKSPSKNDCVHMEIWQLLLGEMTLETGLSSP